jgi:hypothetical protein
VWTSQRQLNGREFCSVFNELIRDDALLDDDVADQVTTLSRAINSNVVTRGVGGDVPWPEGPKGRPEHLSTVADVCFRGGGFCDTPATRAFFAVGRKYRVAGFLATSFNKYVAEGFIARVRCAHWLRQVCEQRSVPRCRACERSKPLAPLRRRT